MTGFLNKLFACIMWGSLAGFVGLTIFGLAWFKVYRPEVARVCLVGAGVSGAIMAVCATTVLIFVAVDEIKRKASKR
jgi:hypothetical protein